MTTNKLKNILEVISKNLHNCEIPYAVIGAIALSFYGIPRYTADIDLLTDRKSRKALRSMMEKLGYICFQETESFAQFDSDMNILGKIDFLFVGTEDGRKILSRCRTVSDTLIGEHPVVQPSDFIILKLMAVANNEDRKFKDESDIALILKLFKENQLPDHFESIDFDRIRKFSQKFNQLERITQLFVLSGI